MIASTPAAASVAMSSGSSTVHTFDAQTRARCAAAIVGVGDARSAAARSGFSHA